MGEIGRIDAGTQAPEKTTLPLGEVGRTTEEGRNCGLDMKRAAIYARVSTSSSQNPAMQLEEIRKYCGDRGWNVAGEYVDAGISGAKEQRNATVRLEMVRPSYTTVA